MGKAISKAIKAKAENLLELIGDRFSADFDKNKKVLQQLEMPYSKEERNVIAGYITRLKNQEAEAA
ncbi:MAG: 30S ribosomal protein S17e [Candidatus Diapherotrites archaeon CG08_land_8_20_14_0_20_34_12]|nr:MAG: 30S ribosomal protein S17e [Candidatus Diapherotrites archaeon CG08_land_8_20_14_0_20_34_12]